MNKIEIYPRVVVYKNNLPKWKEYISLLKKSETEPPRYYFKDWEDWYGFGRMMNISMNKRNEEYIIDSSDEYAALQKIS